MGNITPNLPKNQLTFESTTLTLLDNRWLASSDIAKALGYSRADAVTKIYDRNKDEFSADMTETPILGVSGNLNKSVRVFSLRGAHLIAMFAKTPVAKDFRKWALDILDNVSEGSTPAVPDFSDPAAAARAWAEQYDALEEAKRTKAEISTRREATAMNTAAQAMKKVKLLERKTDTSGQFATIRWMQAHYTWYFDWQKLTRISHKLGHPPLDVHDVNNHHRTIQAFHESVWLKAYGLEIPAMSGGNHGQN